MNGFNPGNWKRYFNRTGSSQVTECWLVPKNGVFWPFRFPVLNCSIWYSPSASTERCSGSRASTVAPAIQRCGVEMPSMLTVAPGGGTTIRREIVILEILRQTFATHYANGKKLRVR